jgi:hypothetical protein
MLTLVDAVLTNQLWSNEVRVALSPSRAHLGLLAIEAPAVTWRWLHRPALVLFVIAAIAPNVAVGPSIAAIASSDFHASAALARCRTFVFARERTAAGVLEAIQRGRTVAIDQFGHRYGDPALVRQLDRLETSVRTDTHAAWRRIATSMVWAGVLVLLLFA